MYLPLEPYNSFQLKVSDLHTLYVEESGNPEGIPIMYFHSGPGSGTKPLHRQYFNPEKYRIILFDQRGSGKSTPFGEIKENTTTDLINDIELIREYLKIEDFYISGGSWGSTLALVYAEKFPSRVLGLILRSIFLASAFDFEWYFEKGANLIFPDLWEKLIDPIPESERSDIVGYYYKRFLEEPTKVPKEMISGWLNWDGRLYKMVTEDINVDKFNAEEIENFILSSRIPLHYNVNNCFIEEEQIMNNIENIKTIPTTIIQGRYDMVCPLVNAWTLHKSLAKSKLVILPKAGHHYSEEGMVEAIVNATDKFADDN